MTTSPKQLQKKADVLFREGNEAMAVERFVDALQLFGRARALFAGPVLSRDPGNHPYLLWIAVNSGICLHGLGRFPDALAAFEGAMAIAKMPSISSRPELDGDRAKLTMKRGASLGRLPEALEAYDAALALHQLPHLASRPELDGDRANLAMNRGTCLDSLGRLPEAMDEYPKPHGPARIHKVQDTPGGAARPRRRSRRGRLHPLRHHPLR